MQENVLTRRENQVAEIIAWGAAKKEVADMLHISPRTVENIARSIYQKIGVNKANELSAWWFCTRFNISFDLSPMARRSVAMILLSIVTLGNYMSADIVRVVRTQRTTTGRARAGRRDDTFDYLTAI